MDKKVGGLRLKLEIAQSNLGAKIVELDRVKDKLADVTTERDYLKKILSNLSEGRHLR